MEALNGVKPESFILELGMAYFAEMNPTEYETAIHNLRAEDFFKKEGIKVLQRMLYNGASPKTKAEQRAYQLISNNPSIRYSVCKDQIRQSKDDNVDRSA